MLRKHRNHLLSDSYAYSPIPEYESKNSTAPSKTLETIPADPLYKISTFLSYHDLITLRRTSKKILAKSNAHKSFYEKKASEHCHQKKESLNNTLVSNIDDLHTSFREFKNNVSRNLHVNIFKDWYVFELAKLSLNAQDMPTQAMPLYTNYVAQMEKDLNRYQCSLRSFICCTGEVGFQPMELPDSKCSSHCCSKPGCFNTCCDPSMNLRCGTPQFLIGGISALLCPIPTLSCCLFQNGATNCAMGIPAKIGHEYRLYKTRKLLNENEVFKLVKKYSFLDQKQKEFNHESGDNNLNQANAPQRQLMD